MKPVLGSYNIYRQAKRREVGRVSFIRDGKQHFGLLPQFEWKWVVRFYVGASKPITRSDHNFPICGREIRDGVQVFVQDSCLMTPDNPTETRRNCSCQKAVRKWADKWLETHTALLQRGELDRLTDLLTLKKRTPVGEVLAVYLERGPKDRRQRVNFLAAIFEQTTGKDIARMEWADLTRELVYDWIELRQEAGRRGWLGLGAGKNMPVDGWAELRELQRSKKLRRDTVTVAAWNTTILGHVVSAKSIFNGMSREDTLRGLNIPPLVDFLSVKLTKMLPVPKGHREIEEGLLRRIVAEMPRLRDEMPRVWAFVLVCAWLSGRPGKVLELRGDALKVQEDGTGIITQPAAKGGNESFTMVDAECVQAVLAVATVDSLFGARHATDARSLLEQANEWLTRLGMEGTKKMSMFRHHKLNLLRNTLGDEMAAAAAGHTSTAMVRTTYTRNERVVPLVNPFAA